mgnify:CR=1 FL=1
MILDARKTPAQRRYNAPKIIQNPSASSEPWPCKEHHVEGIFKSGKFISFYRNPCYKKKALLLKKGSWGSPISCPISYDSLDVFSRTGSSEYVTLSGHIRVHSCPLAIRPCYSPQIMQEPYRIVGGTCGNGPAYRWVDQFGLTASGASLRHTLVNQHE